LGRRGSTIVGEPLKSNRAARGGAPTSPIAPAEPAPFGAAATAGWCEAGLDLCVLILPTLLAFVPRGAAPLAGFAGLCATGLVLTTPRSRAGLPWLPAALLAALLLWGAVSAGWGIDPWRSLALDLRLAAVFAAGVALAAAATRITAPGRLALMLLIGTMAGIGLALLDLMADGAISRLVSTRPFAAPRLNQISVWVAIVLLPVAALLVGTRRALLAIVIGATMGATVYLLDATGAKTAVTIAVPVAALTYFSPRVTSRLIGALSIIAILTAPLTLPSLAHRPGLFAAVDAFKESAGHRLLIWHFTGERIAERPFFGWGLDASRAVPGGDVEARPGEKFLPLHPHDWALQAWLELGAPGALLLALFVGWLWLCLAGAPWPRLYRASAAGSLTVVSGIAGAGWGIWQEWWLGTLALALFAILVMARVDKPPPLGKPTDGAAGPRLRRGLRPN
jgi:O-antigen ligase